MDKEQAQDILDDFVMRNDSDIDRVSKENPILYNALIDGLDFLSRKFGTGVQTPKIEPKVEEPKVEPKVESKSEEPKAEESKDAIKVGSRFVVMSDAKYKPFNDSHLYLVTEVVNGLVKTKYNDKGGFSEFDFDYQYVYNSVEKGEILMINEGDIFFKGGDPVSEYKILPYTDDSTTNYELVWNGEERYKTNDAFAKAITQKIWIKSKVQELKVGDVFLSNITKIKIEIYNIIGDDYYISKENDPIKEILTKSQIKELINENVWEKVDSSQEFKLGDKFITGYKDILEITKIYVDNVIEFTDEKGRKSTSTEELVDKNLKTGWFKRFTGNEEVAKKEQKRKLKVGDKFYWIKSKNDIYKIKSISKNKFVFEDSDGAKYDRDLNNAEKQFDDKVWVLVDESETPTSAKKAPKTAKSGDTKRSLTKAIEGLELLESLEGLDASEKAELKDLRERLDKLTKK